MSRLQVGAPLAKSNEDLTDLPAKSELDKLFQELMERCVGYRVCCRFARQWLAGVFVVRVW
jgi:hypothetical protein